MSIAFILILLLIGLLPFPIISSFPELTILFLILFVYLVIFFYRLVLSEKSMFNVNMDKLKNLNDFVFFCQGSVRCVSNWFFRVLLSFPWLNRSQ